MRSPLLFDLIVECISSAYRKRQHYTKICENHSLKVSFEQFKAEKSFLQIQKSQYIKQIKEVLL